MDILPSSYRRTSHPTDRSWDQVPRTGYDKLPKKKAEDFIKFDAKLRKNKRQPTDHASKPDLSTYSPEYQQYFLEAEKNLSKKRGYSVGKDLSESEEIGISEADHRHRSEERRVGKECRSRWSRYH